MSYKFFKVWCKTMCAKAGDGLRLTFRNDDGRYIATYGDIRITGNALSRVFTVCWGSGHCALFPQPEAAL